jgi:hypothetical protein
MIVKLTVVMLNDLNFIAAMTLIGTSMEVTSVFIPLEGSSHFAALLPKHKFSLGRPAKDVDNKCTKLMLRRRKDPSFLNTINNIDDDTAVSLLLGQIWLVVHPGFQAGPGCFEFGYKNSGWVTALRPTTGPSADNSGHEPIVMRLVVFKPKDQGLRDRCGDLNL